MQYNKIQRIFDTPKQSYDSHHPTALEYIGGVVIGL